MALLRKSVSPPMTPKYRRVFDTESRLQHISTNNDERDVEISCTKQAGRQLCVIEIRSRMRLMKLFKTFPGMFELYGQASYGLIRT